MDKYRLSLSVIIMFFCFLGVSQEAFTPINNTNSIKDQFKQSTQSLSSIQSDFTQQKYLSYLSTTVTSKGKFWYKKPDKLRWEYTEPFKFLVVMNGEKIVVKDENQTNAYKNKPNNTFQMLNEVLASSVNGSLIDNPDFSFSIAENTSDYQIILKPNKEDAKKIIQKIEMLFSKKNLSVYKITMHEPGGDLITILFENKKVNGAINESVFEVN